MASEGLCNVMDAEPLAESEQEVPLTDELMAIAATWQQTAGMSAAGQLCSLEVKTSQSSSSISCSFSGENASDNSGSQSSESTVTRIASVRVPRRTLKIATSQRAKAFAEKMANQTTHGGGYNALADTVASVPKHQTDETLRKSEVPDLPLAEHRI